MTRIPCSVGILTFNSAATLPRALESVKMCDDIIICDGGSTDDTLAIARSYGCRIIAQDAEFKNADGTLKNYAGVRNQCVDAAKKPWFLYIDSDESASPELMRELASIAAQDDQTAAYRIPVRFIVMGRRIDYASNYPGYQYRVLRTDRGTRFVKPVHEQPPQFAPGATLGTLRGPWFVYWERADVEGYEARNFKYLPMEVERARGMRCGRFLLHFLPWHLRAVFAVLLKSAWYRLLHPFAAHMPLKVEAGRVRYQLRLIADVAKMTWRKTT